MHSVHSSADSTAHGDASMDESYSNVSGQLGAADQKPSFEFRQNSMANRAAATNQMILSRGSTADSVSTAVSKVSTFNAEAEFSEAEQSAATASLMGSPSNVHETESTYMSHSLDARNVEELTRRFAERPSPRTMQNILEMPATTKIVNAKTHSPMPALSNFKDNEYGRDLVTSKQNPTGTLHLPRSQSDSHDSKYRRGSAKSKHEQRTCFKCKKCTIHLVCTHWVACNDYKKKKQAKYKIYICLECKAEYSPCRECAKKNLNAPCTTFYLWEENKDRKTNFSFKCLRCNKRFLRCNFCKALYKDYGGRKAIHTAENCKYLEYLRRTQSPETNSSKAITPEKTSPVSSTNKKSSASPTETASSASPTNRPVSPSQKIVPMDLNTTASPTHNAKSRRRGEPTPGCSDQHPRQLVRMGHAPDSGSADHSFYTVTENFAIARKLKLEADQLDAKANEMKQTAMWLRQLAEKFESAGINV